MTKTEAPERMRLKHVMTATAFRIVEVRMLWRSYLRGLAAERREAARRRGGV